MPRLPDVNAMGARPVGQPRRGAAGAGALGPVPEYRVPPPRGTLALAAATEGLGEGLVRAGALVADKERERQDRESRYEMAAAESAFYRKKVALDNSFDDDPDYQTYGQRYSEEMKAAREQAAAQIKDPERRRIFDLKAGDAEAQGLAQIGKKAQAREKDVGRGYLIDTIDANNKAALEARDEATRNQLLLSTDSSLVAARDKGHISFEEEARFRQATTEKFATSWANTRTDEELIKLLAPVSKGTEKPVSGRDYFTRLAKVESNGDPNAVHPKSGAAGKYQFMPDTAKQYGIDPKNPEQAEDGVRRFRADNAAVLTKTLGRKPTESEEYLAHQQGAGGASALLRNPDRSALEALTEAHGGNRAKAAKAIVDNGGTLGMTAGEFSAKQQARFSTSLPEQEMVANGETFGFKKTGTPLDFLSADKKVAIFDQSLRRSAALEDRAQRQAEKNFREAGEQANKDLTDIEAVGRLDLDAVQRRRSVLSATEYQAWTKKLDPKTQEIKDNRETVARLEPMLDTPEAALEIQREFNLGNLSIPTYSRMLEKNRSLLKDDQPDSPYKAGRSFISDALDPGQLGGDAMMQQPLRIARQRAIAEYDAWVEANPKASRSKTMERVDELVTQYQTVGFGEMRLSLPRPRGYVGNKQDVQKPDVEAARLNVLERLDKRELTQDQAARELSNLDIWENVLMKAARK